MRTFIKITIAGLIAGLLGFLILVGLAMQKPVVRRATLALSDWPSGARPVSVVLVSDIHVAGPDMPPSRLREIVQQINALNADVVLIAGDFVSDKRPATKHYGTAEALAPLALLRPRMATIAVLGNHDHWRGRTEVVAALKAANILLLENRAVSMGPLRIGGVDDLVTGFADLDATNEALGQGAGAKVLLSHSPDVAASVPKDVGLILAGHTHCGQVRLPFIGTVATASRYGHRYACGLVKEGNRRTITTAGLGTSILPIRLGARSEVWLIILGPQG